MSPSENDDDRPLWSPDDATVVFRRNLEQLYRIDANGTDLEVLLESDGELGPWEWSDDGRNIVLTHSSPDATTSIWALPLDGSREQFWFCSTSCGRLACLPTVNSSLTKKKTSPVGWRYTSVALSHRGVPGALSTLGGRSPKWSPDGRRILYLNPDNELVANEVAFDGTELRLGETRTLFTVPAVRFE